MGNLYVGVGGTARNVGGIYVGVDGTARKVLRGYVGVNGTARLFYDKTTPYTFPERDDCLTFTSPSSFTIAPWGYSYSSTPTTLWDGVLEWSTDGVTWTVWDGTTIASADGGLCLRGTGNSKISGGTYTGRFVITGSEVSCRGNVETLLDYATVLAGSHPEMASYCFAELFYECTALVYPPRLPATALNTGCYERMFYNCGNLRNLLALPATYLPDRCYHEMFAISGVSSIVWIASNQVGSYSYAFRVPAQGQGYAYQEATLDMCKGRGTISTATLSVNVTYYLNAPLAE